MEKGRPFPLYRCRVTFTPYCAITVQVLTSALKGPHRVGCFRSRTASWIVCWLGGSSRIDGVEKIVHWNFILCMLCSNVLRLTTCGGKNRAPWFALQLERHTQWAQSPCLAASVKSGAIRMDSLPQGSLVKVKREVRFLPKIYAPLPPPPPLRSGLGTSPLHPLKKSFLANI